MSSPLLEAAFAHHVWATLRVIDACLDLNAEELETNVRGTRGPLVAEADGNRTRLPAFAGTPVLKTGGPTRRPDASASQDSDAAMTAARLQGRRVRGDLVAD